MAFKDIRVQSLKLTTIILFGQSVFADTIKLRTLKWEDYPGYFE